MREILFKLENLFFYPYFSSLFFSSPNIQVSFLFSPSPGGRRSSLPPSLLNAAQATALRLAALKTLDKEPR